MRDQQTENEFIIDTHNSATFTLERIAGDDANVFAYSSCVDGEYCDAIRYDADALRRIAAGLQKAALLLQNNSLFKN